MFLASALWYIQAQCCGVLLVGSLSLQCAECSPRCTQYVVQLLAMQYIPILLGWCGPVHYIGVVWCIAVVWCGALKAKMQCSGVVHNNPPVMLIVNHTAVQWCGPVHYVVWFVALQWCGSVH